MKTVGFVISEKENEKRRAIILEDIKKIKNKNEVFFEDGYGENFGFSNQDIINCGCNILSKDKIYGCDIIIDPKIGDSKYLKKLYNKTVFGWIHATQNYDITQTFIENKLTGYAWEKMFENGKHIFYRNNQIAGEAGIIHAMTLMGSTFENANIAILGNGNTSKGVQRILEMFKTNYKVFSRKEEKYLRQKIKEYNIIINCILWDTKRKDHIIYKSDLKNMKKGSLIIDISCDKNGGIETSIPTTIENPIYVVDGIIHYVVDHTPTLLYKDATQSISKEIYKYVDDLILENNNKILDNSLIIKNGKIIDNEINLFQKRII